MNAVFLLIFFHRLMSVSSSRLKVFRQSSPTVRTMTPPESLGRMFLHHLAQPGPFSRALDLAADAHLGGIRHEDQEPAGQRNLAGDARALGADGFLGDLDEHRLAALQQVLDGGQLRAAARLPAAAHTIGRLGPCRFGFRLGRGSSPFLSAPVRRRPVVLVGLDEVGGVQEGAFLGADVDEGGLDPWQHGVDLPEVDVADHAAGVRAIDQQFNERVVLDDGDPRLARRAIDQDFAFQRSGLRPTPRPGRAGAPATLTPDRFKRGVRARRRRRGVAARKFGGCARDLVDLGRISTHVS